MAKDPTICSCEYRTDEHPFRWRHLWVGETHANTPTGAFGGATYGPTKRCPGRGNCMRAPPLGPS
eukprot:3050662-Pyramimonas_sp.AAC.1